MTKNSQTALEQYLYYQLYVSGRYDLKKKKKKYTFILQGWITLMKSYSKDIHNTKNVLFK